MTMKFRCIFATSALLATTGCATKQYGTVLPKGDGQYQVITQGSSSGRAYKAAQYDAETTCKKETGDKRFIALENEAEFTGVKVDRGDGGTARSIIAGAAEIFAAKELGVNNYQVNMFFSCAAGPQPTKAVARSAPKQVAVEAAPVADAAPVVAEIEAPAATQTEPHSLSGRTDIDAIVKAAMANR